MLDYAISDASSSCYQMCHCTLGPALSFTSFYSYACSQTRTLCFGVGIGFSYVVVVCLVVVMIIIRTHSLHTHYELLNT